MTYETFKQAVLTRISCDISEPKRISIQSFYRNNGASWDGLVILENGCNISPAIYLNHYYERLLHEESFDELCEEILEQYQTNKTDVSIDVRFFTEFRNVKPHLSMKLINYEKNRAVLDELPHIRFLDLAVVFYCFIPMDEAVGNATILIRESHRKLWNIDVDTLYQTAKENVRQILPPRFIDLNTMLLNGMPETGWSPAPLYEDPLYPMFVLTNEEGLFGAACMLYDQLLRGYSDRFQADFYILPSSIHEVILVPAYEKNDLAEYSGIVREVNRTNVAPEEILADHAYYYSRAENVVSM